MKSEVSPSREEFYQEVESRILGIETRLKAWTTRTQLEGAAAEIYRNADLFVIADLLRQKLAIQQQLQELKTAPNPYWPIMLRVIDMDLTDLESALRRMEPK